MTKTVSSLGNISDYYELLEYCTINKNKPFNEWLEFDSTFGKPGKQGLTGLLMTKTGKKIVFKVSQYINYLVHHEYTVMNSLSDLIPYCPHFCKVLGIVTTTVDPNARKEGNPFRIESKYPIEKDVLLCEYIDKSCKFYNLIRAVDRVPENVLYTSILQVLAAIAFGQSIKLTHYDIHSYNIMMKRCSKDAVFLYVFDKNTQFAVPTNGWYPVIIDFGFSYSSGMDDGPLLPSMGHTCAGFNSDRYDWVRDPMLFLTTVSFEIKYKRKSRAANKLRRMVRNMFFPLNIEWTSGWDTTEDDPSAADIVCDLLANDNEESKLFEEYDGYCIDILQSLIIMPIEKQDYTDLTKSFRAFIHEWVKIEKEITSPFYNLHLLKCVVDIARSLRGLYVNSETREQAVFMFKNQVLESVGKIAKYCTPKEVHYEKLLCGMYVFSKCLEGLYYEIMNDVMKPKHSSYHKLPVKNIEQIFAVIQTNMDDEYEYSDKTSIIVLDSINKNTKVYQLTEEQATSINEIHPICRGTTLYDILLSK
jgi:hypothetical protein